MPAKRAIRAGLGVGLCVVLVGSGCGGSDVTRPGGAHLSVGAAYALPGFVACMRRHSITVLPGGALRLGASVTAADLDGAESACGFDTAGKRQQSESEAEARSERQYARSVLKTSAVRRLLVILAACLRSHGVTVAQADVSGLREAEHEAAGSVPGRAAIAACRAEALAAKER